MASVRKRFPDDPKSPWVVDYTDQSGTRRLKTFKMKKLADAFRMKMEAEISEGLHTADRESVTVGEAADSFMKECDRRHHIGDKMTGSSRDHYETGCKFIKERFGSLLIKSLTTPMVQAYIDEFALTRKKTTVVARYRCFLQILQHSVRKGWVKRNVLKDHPVRLPETAEEKVRIPSKEDIIKIIDSTMREPRKNERLNVLYADRAVVLLGFHAGMRAGEIAGLQWENVDFEEDIIRVRHSHSRADGLKSPKSQAGKRDIPMSPDLRKALIDLWQYWVMRERVVRLDQETALRFFRNKDKRSTVRDSVDCRLNRRLRKIVDEGYSPDPLDTPLTGYVMRTIHTDGKGGFASYQHAGVHNLLASWWPKILKRAGMLDKDGRNLYSSHKMRHAAVSLMIEAGLPMLNLKTVIGHSNIKTTMGTYAHLFPDDQRTRSAVMDLSATLDATRAQQKSLTS